MSASQDYVALDWIKGEIGQTLKQAQQALEVVAESPEDTGSLRSCLTAIHQVHGTLQMVQLAGPTQVASEMEQLSQALMNNNVPDIRRAQEVLMQSILQMPGYLDRIHREQQDLEANYLPIVNNLRVARGESRIPGEARGTVSAGPSLELFRGPAADSAVVAYGSGNGVANLPKLRTRFQQALLAVLKRNNARENLTLIGRIFAMLIKLCGASPVGHGSVLGLALIEGVTSGAIKLDNSVASLLKLFDKSLKQLIEGGAVALNDPIPEDLVTGMIEAIDKATKETPRILEAKALYTPAIADSEDGQDDGMGLGPDDETLSTVARIIREELTSVTDKLDLFVRSTQRNNADLLELLPLLMQISGTLTVVGLTDHQQSVSDQVAFLKTLDPDGESPNDEQLLDMARALLQIESSLAGIAGDDEGADADAFGDLNDAQAAVVRETRNGLARCRDSVVEFVSSEFDHSKIEDLASDLMALRGGLLMANQNRAGDVLISASGYVGEIVSSRGQPALAELDDLADALTSIDYYLERLLENANDPYLQMVEVAEAAVEKLGFPVGSGPAVVSTAATGSDEAAISESESGENVQSETVGTSGSEDTPAIFTQEDTVPEGSADEVVEEVAEEKDEDELIDDEILEIFVEEVSEVLETINEFLPVWRENRDDEEALTEVRRAYHTLKGSGRMVGATVVGELAWSVENMLNRVIDGTVGAGDDLLTLVGDVTGRVPEGIEHFQNGNQEAFEVNDLMERAEAMAEGRAPRGVSAEATQEPAESTDVEPSLAEDIETSESEEAISAGEVEEDLESFAPGEIADEPDTAIVAEEMQEKDVETEGEDLESSALEDIEDEPDTAVVAEEMLVEDVEIEGEDLESFELDDIADEPDTAVATEEMQVEDIEIEGEDLESFELDDMADETDTAEASFSVDASSGMNELEEIFLDEAVEKLQLIRGYLAAPGVVNSELVAAFHTLKGSAAVAGIPVISQLAGPLEQLALQFLSREPDQAFLATTQRGADLIEQVTGNLALYSEALPGAEEFLLGFEQLDRPVFRFDDIRLLSEVHRIADEFDSLNILGLVQELEHVRIQAEEVGHEGLLPLVTLLISLYQKAATGPSEDLVEGLQAGHDELLRLFDMIAAGQSATCDPVVIDRLGELASLPVVPQEVPAVTGDETMAREAPTDAGWVELPPDEVDEDVLPIFLEEAEELVEGIDLSILSWSESPESPEHLDNLLRHLHTLKGGARMSGIASLGEFTHNFESFLIGLQSHPVPLDDGFFGLLNQQQDEILRRVEIYQRLADGDDVSDELQAMRYSRPIGDDLAASGARTPERLVDQAPVPSDPADNTPLSIDLPADEVDEDILPIFLEESEELAEALDQSIQSWSESPDDMTHLDHLLRHLHTLKGGARMAGLNSLGEYAHNFETYLISIQQAPGHLDDRFFSLVNQRQDEITRRLEIYNRLAAGDASEDELASMMKVVEPRTDTDVSVTDAGAPDERQSVDEPMTTRAPEKEAEKSNAAQSAEMVRVSSDLLEELISLAGEASITRGRVEQQISDFGDAIDEMEGTINRIREQVRRLEIEAESRETLLSQRSDEGDGAFDELEMDRYTLLQEISRSLNEGSSDMMDLKDTLINRSRDAETLLHQQARIAGELQEGLTRTRMVPFARLIPRLRRIVRQVSAEVGKSVRFDAFNVEGELDRSVLDRIVAPLEHMLRNAVDHGIESGEQRTAAGKPEQGRISLRLSREGGYVILLISDDGGGINVDAVKKKAIERGLLTEDSVISDNEVMQFILHAGFSTAQKLTQISGRGVGMDVVVSEIKALGGSVTIDSTLGVGTEFTIRIPFTVSINRALMVVVHDEAYAVPLNTIEGIVRVSPYELEAYYQPEAPLFEYAGQPYRLQYMGKMLDKSESPNLEGQIAPLPVILARSGDHAVALQVDRVIGSREVVVKSLGSQFNEVGGISGATVLGDGSVVIILDVMALVRSYEATQVVEPVVDDKPEPEPVSKVRTVMIVDDSVTVRKVTSRLMERQGWEVITAKDGLDAVTQLQDIIPDIVLLDIEMPRMDGFEVLRRVRSEDRLAGLPIIMITSRTGEKHREQALELGVNEFLGKPFQEASLISTINQVIEG